MPEDELLDLPEIHGEEEPESKWRKIFVMMMGLFLIFLMVSYVLASPQVQDLIISMIQSDTIEDGLVQQDIEVEFLDGSYEVLLDYYLDNQRTEFKACLIGSVEERYRVNEVIFPTMIERSFNRVVSTACPKETIISLHSHPYHHCVASEQDLKNLEMAKKNDPDAVISIMCGPDRFNFYN